MEYLTDQSERQILVFWVITYRASAVICGLKAQTGFCDTSFFLPVMSCMASGSRTQGTQHALISSLRKSDCNQILGETEKHTQR